LRLSLTLRNAAVVLLRLTPAMQLVICWVLCLTLASVAPADNATSSIHELSSTIQRIVIIINYNYTIKETTTTVGRLRCFSLLKIVSIITAMHSRTDSSLPRYSHSHVTPTNADLVKGEYETKK
jgi:hypothetical protein